MSDEIERCPRCGCTAGHRLVSGGEVLQGRPEVEVHEGERFIPIRYIGSPTELAEIFIEQLRKDRERWNDLNNEGDDE